MNKLIYLAALTVLAGGISACNESTTQDSLDVQSSRTAIAKDNDDIATHQSAIEKQRAAKARAKASGDTLGQAKSSVNIGAHKVGKAWNEGEKAVDEQILEEDKKDLRQ